MREAPVEHRLEVVRVYGQRCSVLDHRLRKLPGLAVSTAAAVLRLSWRYAAAARWVEGRGVRLRLGSRSGLWGMRGVIAGCCGEVGGGIGVPGVEFWHLRAGQSCSLSVSFLLECCALNRSTRLHRTCGKQGCYGNFTAAAIRRAGGSTHSQNEAHSAPHKLSTWLPCDLQQPRNRSLLLLVRGFPYVFWPTVASFFNRFPKTNFLFINSNSNFLRGASNHFQPFLADIFRPARLLENLSTGFP